MVRVEFQSVADRDAGVAAWRPLAAHCRAHEPGTLSYELAVSDADPRAVVFVERYATKDRAFLEQHRSSTAFLKFRPELARLEPKVTGHSYIASDIGFF